MSFDQKFLSKVRREFPAVETDPTGRKRAFSLRMMALVMQRRAGMNTMTNTLPYWAA